MSHRFRHHATIDSREAREAEIAAAWHTGRLSLLWAIAFVVAVIAGAPPAPPDALAAQPDAAGATVGMSWGA
jgi:hypothetical protein